MGEFPTAQKMFWELKEPENHTVLEDLLAREKRVIADKHKPLPWQSNNEMYAEIASDVNTLLDSDTPPAELHVDDSRFIWKNALYSTPLFATMYGIDSVILNYAGWEFVKPAVAIICMAGPLLTGINTGRGGYAPNRKAIEVQGRDYRLAQVLAHEHTHHVQLCSDSKNQLVHSLEASLKETIQKITKTTPFIEGIAMNVEYIECNKLSERYSDTGFSATGAKAQIGLLKNAIRLLRKDEAPSDGLASFARYKNPTHIFGPTQYALGNAYYRVQCEKHGPGILAQEIRNIAA